MSKKHLHLRPHNIVPGVWWYEENAGITVVVEHFSNKEKYQHTEQYKIPWASIRAALKRKDQQ